MAERSESVNAVDLITLYRIKGEAGDAWKLALQVDNSTDESRDYESTPTKDGTIKTAGAYEGTHSLTSQLAKGDTHVRELKKLVREPNPRTLEVWDINRSDIADSTTLPGDYSEDVVTSVGTSAGSEGSVEVSIETEVIGTIVDGEVTVTPALLEILQAITEDQEFVQPTSAGPEARQAAQPAADEPEDEIIEEDE